MKKAPKNEGGGTRVPKGTAISLYTLYIPIYTTIIALLYYYLMLLFHLFHLVHYGIKVFYLYMVFGVLGMEQDGLKVEPRERTLIG